MKFRTLITITSIALVFAACNKPEEPEKPTPQPVDTVDNFPYGNPVASEAFVDQLVDGGFETYWFWETTPDGDCINYKSSMLYTLNNLYALADYLGCNAPITTQFDRDSHGGKYALKLRTGKLQNENGELLIPGAIAPLNDNFIDEFLNSEDGNISVERPYTAKPTAIKGYFKYHPELGDSASVTVILYNNAKEAIGKARWLQKEEVTTWTPFYQQVVYTSNETPAYISLVYAASAGYNFADLLNCQGQAGSTLWLDDMELEF